MLSAVTAKLSAEEIAYIDGLVKRGVAPTRSAVIRKLIQGYLTAKPKTTTTTAKTPQTTTAKPQTPAKNLTKTDFINRVK